MGETIEINILTTATEGSPIDATATVGRGILQNAQILFAQGVNGTNYCRIFNGATQLFPRTASGSYRLVQSPIQIRDEEPLTGASNIIHLKGWASEASYNHIVRLIFDVIPFDRPELII